MLVGLTACDSDDGDPTPTPTDAGTTKAAAADDPRIPSGVDEDLVDPRGALRDLSGFDCAGKGGAWHAAGTVRNSRDDTGEYLVTVSVIRRRTSEVLSRRAATLVVESGERKRFAFDLPTIDAKGTGRVQCVSRVVRGTSYAGAGT